jgi:glycogen debranching enzyme
MERIALRARGDLHFAYSGRSVLVTDLVGSIRPGGKQGFFVDNTRVLSHDELSIEGQPLIPVSASPVGGHGFFAYWEVPESPGIPKDSLYVEAARLVDEGMREEVRVTNYAPEQARFDLRIELAADFADIEEAEHGRRQQDAPISTSWDPATQELCFRYLHPQLDRAVAITVERSPAEVRYEDGGLILPLTLAPKDTAVVVLRVEPIFDGARRPAASRAFGEAHTPLERLRRQLRDEMPVLTTTNATVARAWRTAIEDLPSLVLGLADGPATPSAGMPIYQQFFGRDSLTIGWQSLLATPTLLRDSLLANAAWQGRERNDWLDEEPGKMLHQARWGPLSALGINPFTRYYGDYATAPDFLIMLGEYLAWTNDRDTVRSLLPAARKALAWLTRHADLDGDGFIEYVKRSSAGVKNQGWKDSDDAIVDVGGSIVENPIATSELQAYWYVGMQMAAFALFFLGHRLEALRLLGSSLALRRRFDQAFWMESDDFYAMALGPDKRQVRSISSNTGHLLATGIVPPRKARRVARRLMRPDLFTGWGIRTLSSEHAAYNPFSYHRGSLWPVENGTFAFGFARYGCWDELHRLAEGIFASTELFVDNRLPEVIGGLPRDREHPHPGIYRKSNEPQGWSASMIVLTLQALLGLHPIAPLGLLLIDPHLPRWLPDLELEGIRIGRSKLDLRLWRDADGRTHYRVPGRSGAVRVIRQQPPEAVGVRLGQRLTTLLASLPRS